ncbi:MAG: hypothetical protein HLX50_08850 [Alteromonadaceae bacterium]|nr:hypothetical protein [Alteromonadaceae bacterium]
MDKISIDDRLALIGDLAKVGHSLHDLALAGVITERVLAMFHEIMAAILELSRAAAAEPPTSGDGT